MGRAYSLTVDYDMSVKAYREASNYSYVNPVITDENFPKEPWEAGVKKIRFYLRGFRQGVKSEAAIDDMRVNGLRPGVIREFLAFGREGFETLKQHPIVLLGSLWKHPIGIMHVVCLVEKGKHLGLNWFGYGWYKDFRFFAVEDQL